MANLNEADSPLCRRIVLSFLDFLNSVERSSVGDAESLDVAKDCLSEAFKIDSSSSTSSVPKSDYLVQIFSSQPGPDNEIKSDQTPEKFQADTSTVNDPFDSKTPEASQTLGVTDKQDNRAIGMSEDELFAHFLESQHKAGLLRMYTPNKAKKQARRLFDCALEDMEEYGVEVLNVKNLADIFKLKGNDFMLFMGYSNAIHCYTVAIALCADNAIYYCNRAAAYTQTKQYTEAISDCEKAIEIDPSYCKAFSRLGFVYFAQGNYSDAIHKGFKKALQLDPDNEAVKGNIRAAEQKLMEKRERESRSSSHNSESYPQFDLNDYPLASDSDRQIMNMINEYNRRNHAIIAEQNRMGEQGVSDYQIENLSEALRSLCHMSLDDRNGGGTQDDVDNSLSWTFHDYVQG